MAMNDQQVLFYVGKQKLAYYEEIEKTRPLTQDEEHERSEINRILFESVVRFGVSQAHKRLAKYRKDGDAFQDIQQDLAVIFYEKLPDYDPTVSTPTTYFLRYFNQKITEYVLAWSQHMSQYDAHNVSVVRAAIKAFEDSGIQWDEQMLATKTGLSPKVIKNTLRLASNSIMSNIDDIINMSSNLPTPEEEFLSNEKTATIYRALNETLSRDELALFLYKLNLDGKERTYQQVAEDLGMQVRDVKKKWSGIIARLNGNRELQSYNGAKNEGVEAKIYLHEKTMPSRMDEALFFSALSATDLHKPEDDPKSKNEPNANNPT